MGLILHESVGISWEMCGVMATVVQPRAESIYGALWKRDAQAPGAAQLLWDRGRCFVGSSIDKDTCIRQQALHGSPPVKQHFQTTHIPKISVFIWFSVYLVPLAGVLPCNL